MKLHAIALILMVGVAPSFAHAQSGGGSGGGGSAGGGASSGTGSAVGSPSAGSAGAGTLGTNGVPPGPANAAGQNNAGNDPSGSGNAPRFDSGTTTGLANPAPATRPNGNSPGTNSAGTAEASGIGGGGTLRSNGTRMPGANGATTTKEQGSDAVIDAENRKLNHALNSICRGC